MKKLNLLPLLTLIACACTFFPQQSFAQFSGNKPEVILYRHNGSATGALPVTPTDTLGTIWFNGLAATNTIRNGASIRSFITGPVSATSLPANLVFRTGATTQQNRMVITSAGLVGIGTMSPLYHLDIVGNTHTSGDFYGRIHMDNTQTTNAAPNTYNDEAYLELKQRTVLGVPVAVGGGTHGGLFTLAPGATSKDHQLFFGDDGIYARRFTGNATSWTGASWFKLLTGEDINGTKNRIAKFTNPNTLGDSQLWDDGTAVGIGTTAPSAGFLLDVNGNTHVRGNVNFTGTEALGGDLSANGNATFGGSALIGGNVTLGGQLNVTNNANLSANLNVQGTTHLNGKVSIGTTNTAGTHVLYVGGSMVAEEVNVKLQASWPDYVFATNAPAPDPHAWDAYIQANQHLPGIPSAREVAQKGSIDLGETQRLLLEKIEQLSLMVIEQQKQIDALKAQTGKQ